MPRRGSVKRRGLQEDKVDHLVTIYYRDWKGMRTSRMIELREIETYPCAGMKRVKSYCHLRRAERDFF